MAVVVLMLRFAVAVIMLVSLSSCNSGAKPSGREQPRRQPAEATPSPNPKTDGVNDGTPNSADSSNRIETLPQSQTGASSIDVVLVNAIGDENPNAAAQQAAFLRTLLAGIAQKFSGRDARLALIASQNAAISGVSIRPDALAGFASGATRQVNFELAPKDAFVGALVAGCSPESSDLNSTHAAGTVKVCGRSVAVPPHSWTWTTEDLKGRVSDFLRPSVKRTYIFIASNDVAMVTAKEFMEIAGSQTGGKGPTILSIIPVAGGGSCSDKNRAATTIDEATKLSSGKTFSYCATDWSTFVSSIVDQL